LGKDAAKRIEAIINAKKFTREWGMGNGELGAFFVFTRLFFLYQVPDFLP
jgi:hypothetical protein